MITGLCILIAIVPIVFAFWIRPGRVPPPESTADHLHDRKAALHEGLRDLQFEYRLGKLSDADYQSAKRSLQKELARLALAIIAAFPLCAAEHAIILEPGPESLAVTEIFRLERKPVETVRVYIPEAALRTLKVTPAIPLRKTPEPDIFKLTHSGVLEVNYTLPPSSTFSGRVVNAEALRLVTPRTVRLSGSGIRFLSQEPRSQANLYELMPTQTSFLVSIETTAQDLPPSQQPRRGPARIFDSLFQLLALIAAILVVGAWLLLKRNKALLGSFAVLLAVLAHVTTGAVEERVVIAGAKAPSFQLKTDDGRQITNRSFGGKLLVLNFWATWCPPCIKEMPSLNQLANKMKANGVVVVAVSVDENEASYQRYLAQLQPDFLTTRDAGLAASFGTFRYPETYVIDSTGTVRKKYVSARDWTDPSVESELRSLLPR